MINFAFKVALFKKLNKLIRFREDQDDEKKMQDLDGYFMSLVILGRHALDIRLIDNNSNQLLQESEVAETKEYAYQSLLDPEFNFERFVTTGSASQFYDTPIMVNEMIFVCSSNPQTLDIRGQIFMMYNYSFVDNDYGMQDYDHGAWSTLCRLYGVKQRSFNKEFVHLKSEIGSDIMNPVRAFTRPF